VCCSRHGERALRGERGVAAADDVGVVHGGAGDVLAERGAGHGRGVEVEQVPELGHQRAQPARVVEVGHQVRAGRADVREHRRAAGDGVEVVERQVHARRAPSPP
jgi:hypothetical protein